jgi:hypothetical protein
LCHEFGPILANCNKLLRLTTPHLEGRGGARIRHRRHQEGIISTEIAPFGGMTESGIVRQGSKYEGEYLCMRGIDR